MPPYDKHLFICTNQRVAGHPRGCCADKGGMEIRAAFARGLADRGLKGKVRANKSGCLDACEMGATVVVYPQGVWYLGVTLNDVDEIIEQSIVAENVVDRLAATPEKWAELQQIRQAANAKKE